MKPILFIILMIATAAAAFALLRQPELNRLRQDNERLRTEAAEANLLAQEVARLEVEEVDPAELERLQTVRSEVLRLRAEVAGLREAARMNPEEAREELIALVEQVEQENERAAFLRTMREAEELDNLARETVRHLVRICTDTARLSEGKLPRSFTELQAALDWLAESGPAQRRPMFQHYADFLLETEESFGPVIEHFEFVPRATPLALSDRPVLLLRERHPRQLPEGALPGGNWIRYYGLSDGRVEHVILPENRFDEWERDFSARP